MSLIHRCVRQQSAGRGPGECYNSVFRESKGGPSTPSLGASALGAVGGSGGVLSPSEACVLSDPSLGNRFVSSGLKSIFIKSSA